MPSMLVLYRLLQGVTGAVVNATLSGDNQNIGTFLQGLNAEFDITDSSDST